MHSTHRHSAKTREREPLLIVAPGAPHVATLLVQRARRHSDSIPLDERAMRRLQTLAGNRAVNLAVNKSRASATAYLQRDGAEPAPVAPSTESSLRAARFADSDRLQRAARNSPPLRQNESDDAVARMQRAFLDLGYTMPVVARSGGPTGYYGVETVATVKKFQNDHGVPPDGVAGKSTLTALDEVCLKHDAKTDVTPALLGGVLHSTQPALETPDQRVSKPEAAATPSSTKAAPEAERKHLAEIEINGGLEFDLLHLGKKPGPDEPSDFFCDKVKVEVAIKGNIDVLRLGERVTLLPNVGLSANLPPVKCGKAPGVEAHVDLLKLKLSEATELAVMTSFQPKNTALTGWIAGGGISFDVQPLKSAPLKVGIEGKGEVERHPLGGTGHFLWVLQGGFAVKYEFGFF